MTEADREVFEDCVIKVVNEGDGEIDTSDDAELLSCSDVDGKEDCVSDGLSRADTDDAGEVEVVALSIEDLEDEGMDDVEKVSRAEFDTEEVVDGVALGRGDDDGLFDRCGDSDVDELDVALVELKEEALSVDITDVEKVI